MTLEDATRKCLIAFHDELPERFKWREGMRCTGADDSFWEESAGWVCPKCSIHLPYPELAGNPPRHANPNHFEHDIPMPEPSDELAMALLRIGKRFELELLVTTHDGGIRWQCRPFPCDDDYDGTEVYAADPRDAIIFACAELARMKHCPNCAASLKYLAHCKYACLRCGMFFSCHD